jgi:hypothetical protein
MEDSAASFAKVKVQKSNIGLASGATDNQIVRADGTAGKIQKSLATIDDAGSINIPTGETYDINGTAHTHAQYANYVDQSGGTSDTYGALAGAINGSNTTYTVSLSAYTTGTLRVYLNGQLQIQGTASDWTETTPASGTFDFVTAPTAGDEITVMYGYASVTPVSSRPMQTEIVLFRDSLNYTVGTNSTDYHFPGNALTASTLKWHADLFSSASVAYARWVNAWDPNATGATVTGIRLIKFDDGPANIEVLQTFELGTSTDPLVSTIEVTTDLQNIISGATAKHIGYQVRGDGTNAPHVYSSIIEIVWS